MVLVPGTWCEERDFDFPNSKWTRKIASPQTVEIWQSIRLVVIDESTFDTGFKVITKLTNWSPDGIKSIHPPKAEQLSTLIKAKEYADKVCRDNGLNPTAW